MSTVKRPGRPGYFKILIGKFLLLIYKMKKRRIRKVVINFILRLDGNESYSTMLRDLFSKFHGVDVGLYSHGGCFHTGNFHPDTTIGRYCSIATTARGMNRNHPMDHKSTHGFFYHPGFGFVCTDHVTYIPLEIGNDVWIGQGAIIMPSVSYIGDGAVIGAGAVVHKDVPPYGIVVGNPARVVRYRFAKTRIEELLREKWWEKDIEEILPDIEEFTVSLEGSLEEKDL